MVIAVASESRRASRGTILEIGCTQDFRLISLQLSTVVCTSVYVALMSVSLLCSQASVAVQCILAIKCLSQFLLQTINHCLSACKLYTMYFSPHPRNISLLFAMLDNV